MGVRTLDSLELLTKARTWERIHAHRWQLITDIMERDVAARRETSVYKAEKETANLDLVGLDGRPSKITHDLLPVLQRDFLSTHPEAVELVTMRGDCKFNQHFPELMQRDPAAQLDLFGGSDD